jgi:hypothetical protein
MRVHSKEAWDIASIFSHALASETRDLAAHIDKAFEAKDAEITRLRAEVARARDEALEEVAKELLRRAAMLQDVTFQNLPATPRPIVCKDRARVLEESAAAIRALKEGQEDD